MDEVTSAKIRAGDVKECHKVRKAIKAVGVRGAANALGIHRATLYRWVAANKGLLG